MEGSYSYIVREKVAEIALDRRKRPEQNAELIDFLNLTYFAGDLLKLSENALIDKLKAIPNELLTKEFEVSFLTLLDMIKPRLLHNLGPVRLSKSLDWSAFRDTAYRLYESGQRKTAILISLDGVIGLGMVESAMSLNNRDEVFIQFFPADSLQQMTLRIKWEDLLNGSFNFDT